MKKLISFLVLGIYLSTGFISVSAYAQGCNTSDFQVGIFKSSPADACFTGDPSEGRVISQLNSTWGPKWNLFAKYDSDDGVKKGSMGVIELRDTNLWFANFRYLNKLDDAAFVIKQPSRRSSNADGFSWVAYLVEDIQKTWGTFNTNLFSVDDYKNVRMYGRTNASNIGAVAVPEIDGASAGIALSLTLSLLALMRERRSLRLRRR